MMSAIALGEPFWGIKFGLNAVAMLVGARCDNIFMRELGRISWLDLTESQVIAATPLKHTLLFHVFHHKQGQDL